MNWHKENCYSFLKKLLEEGKTFKEIKIIYDSLPFETGMMEINESQFRNQAIKFDLHVPKKRGLKEKKENNCRHCFHCPSK